MQESLVIGPAIDRTLVDHARGGDLGAFESIVRSRTDAIYRLTVAILGNDADARDATQETFVVAWRQLGRLRDVDRFDAWLRRVAINTSRMTLRARRRRRVREIPASEIVIGESDAVATETRDDAAVLHAALRRLSVDQRAVLVLHHLEGRPLDEISITLDIPVGTAKSRLFHARRALQNALDAEEHDR